MQIEVKYLFYYNMITVNIKIQWVQNFSRANSDIHTVKVPKTKVKKLTTSWACGVVGSAFALQAKGQEFDSLLVQKQQICYNASNNFFLLRLQIFFFEDLSFILVFSIRECNNSFHFVFHLILIKTNIVKVLFFFQFITNNLSTNFLTECVIFIIN